MRIRLVSRLLVTIAALGVSCAPSSVEPSLAAPAISSITPSASPVGTAVTLTGSGFASERNAVKFGTGYIKNISSADGKSLRFTVPEGLDLCPPDPTGPCPGAFPRVAPGDYPVAVMTQGNTSNSITFTVTGP